MIQAADEPLTYIFNTFKVNNKIDLWAVKGYFDANKNLKEECKILIGKLENYLSSKKTSVLSKEEFFRYFNQSVADSAHFNAVFDSIDTDNSGFISKNELKQLFRKFHVPFTEQELSMMVEVCSQDGQKISRKDLEQFLRN